MTTTTEPRFDWMTTYGGTHFDYFDPDPAAMHIADIAQALGNVARFGGHTTRHFSVAQHSLLVSHLVPLLGGLDGDAYAGLMHDAQEAYVGDCPTPLKRGLPEYRAVEDGIAAVLYDRFHVARPLPAVVKQADLYALYLERDELAPNQPGPWEHEHVSEDARELLIASRGLPDGRAAAYLVGAHMTQAHATERFLIRFAQLAPEEAR